MNARELPGPERVLIIEDIPAENVNALLISRQIEVTPWGNG
jgi:hypothetical protein